MVCGPKTHEKESELQVCVSAALSKETLGPAT